MADGRHSAPRGRRKKPSGSKDVANNQRLVALGEAVDRQSGIERKPRREPGAHRHRRRLIISGIVVVALLAALLGGGYLYANWRFSQIPKVAVANELPQLTGQPFNILEIGSDSRAGLTGGVAAQTGASSGTVSGQRSDVVKIMHIDPAKGTISVISIPRDTMVTLVASQSLYGNANRINVNFADGPSMLAKTITSNFGIPIQHVIVVSFAGLMNGAIALGGVYLNFPYPARDAYSGLKITHTGCQLINGFEALAVARSRHYEYFQNGQWLSDGTSDFGRIDRQNAFMRAMIIRAKSLYNPLTINSFLSKIPAGITLDSNFTLNELIALAVKFHSLNPSAMLAYTMPTVSAVSQSLGDVLYVDQPAAQQLLVNMFGSTLLAPTNPPPNTAGQTPPPPVVTPTPSSTSTTVAKTKSTAAKKSPVTTTTNPSQATPYFDPTPC
jgi:LCP family protein required for cell wall assembly